QCAVHVESQGLTGCHYFSPYCKPDGRLKQRFLRSLYIGMICILTSVYQSVYLNTMNCAPTTYREGHRATLQYALTRAPTILLSQDVSGTFHAKGLCSCKYKKNQK